MLRAQHARQLDQLLRLLESREDLFFLGLLVVGLDEPANQVGRTGKHLRRGAVAREPRLVDEQGAVEHAVLAHQVLSGRDFFLFLLRFGCRR